MLIALAFVCAHVATARILLVGTRLAALISLEQMTFAVRAAARISSINRRTAGQQNVSLCRADIILQKT